MSSKEKYRRIRKDLKRGAFFSSLRNIEFVLFKNIYIILISIFTFREWRVDVTSSSCPVTRSCLLQQDFIDTFCIIFAGHEQHSRLHRHSLTTSHVARTPHTPFGHRTTACQNRLEQHNGNFFNWQYYKHF